MPLSRSFVYVRMCVYVIENVLVYKNENRNLPKTSREKETTTV